MIKYLAFEYQTIFSFLNIFSYITFRSGAAILTSLFFSLIFGNFLIDKLSNIQPSGQPIRQDGPESHIIAKKGTPTMGGLLIILSVLFSTILWADLENNFIWISIFTILIFGLIGFADDYKKIKIVESKIHIKIFCKSAQIIVETKTLKIINRPPIVGVPFFAIICDSGPSSLIGWPVG